MEQVKKVAEVFTNIVNDKVIKAQKKEAKHNRIKYTKMMEGAASPRVDGVPTPKVFEDPSPRVEEDPNMIDECFKEVDYDGNQSDVSIIIS